MAYQFTLTPRCDPEHGPMYLQHVDVGIAEFMGEQLDDKRWCLGWFDNIGFWFAAGYTKQQITNQLLSFICSDNKDAMNSTLSAQQAQLAIKNLAILEFIDANYIVNCWYGR